MSLPSFQDFLEKTACFVIAYDSLWTFHVHVEDVLQWNECFYAYTDKGELL